MEKISKLVEDILSGKKTITVKYLHEIVIYGGETSDGQTGLVVDVFSSENGSTRDRSVTWLSEILGSTFHWSDLQQFALLIGRKLGAKEPFMQYLTGMYLFSEGLVEELETECFVTEIIDPEVYDMKRSFTEGEIILFPLRRMDDVGLGFCSGRHNSVALKLSDTTEVVYSPEKLRLAREMAQGQDGIVVGFVCVEVEDGRARLQALGDEDGVITVFNAMLSPELEFLGRTGQRITETVERHHAIFKLREHDYYDYCREGMIIYHPRAKIGKSERDAWVSHEFNAIIAQVDIYRRREQEAQLQALRKIKKRNSSKKEKQ